MNKHRFVSFIVGVSSFFIVGTSAFANDISIFKELKGNIRIAGGTAHIPVMKEVAKKIMRYNKDIHISISGGGSGVGIKQVGEGLIDIGNSGRKPTEKEISKYNLKMFRWAVDGIGIVVNPKNEVRSLSKEQAKKIFAGKITNWNELGGVNKKINVYTRDVASGTRAVFWKKAMDKETITPKANFVASNGAMKVSVSKDPYGIGYISVGYMDKMVAPVVFDGVAPTVENVASGAYTVSRGIFSNTKGEPVDLVKKFIDYLYTEDIQKIIKDKGFIPVLK